MPEGAVPEHSAQPKLSRKKTRPPQPSNKPDDDGDWWESPDSDVTAAIVGTRRRRITNPPKAGEDRKLKEISVFFSLLTGSLAVGIPGGICGAIHEPKAATTFLVCFPTVIFLFSSISLLAVGGNRVARVGIAATSGGAGLLLAGLMGLAVTHVGNVILSWFGYRASKVPQFVTEEEDSSPSRYATTRCPECRHTMTVPGSRIGFWYDCPRCAKPFKVEERSS